jgi:hypothetical protein
MKQSRKKLLVVLGALVAVITVGVLAYAFQPGAMGANGEISVVWASYERSLLDAKIKEAQTEKANTDISPTPVSPSTRTYYAPQTAHTALDNAIALAQGVYNSTGTVDKATYARSERFDITVNLDSNIGGGFASMMLRLELPPQLEVVRIAPGSNFANGTHQLPGEDPHPYFQGGAGWTGGNVDLSSPRDGAVVVSWAKTDAITTGNYSNTGNLITYTLRVKSGAALGRTAPIRFGFGNGLGDTPEVYRDVPQRFDATQNTNLAMSVNGTLMTGNYELVNIGTIMIQ